MEKETTAEATGWANDAKPLVSAHNKLGVPIKDRSYEKMPVAQTSCLRMENTIGKAAEGPIVLNTRART